MPKPSPAKTEYATAARSLQAALSRLGHQVPYAHALEAVAQQRGHADYNTALAAIPQAPASHEAGLARLQAAGYVVATETLTRNGETTCSCEVSFRYPDIEREVKRYVADDTPFRRQLREHIGTYHGGTMAEAVQDACQTVLATTHLLQTRIVDTCWGDFATETDRHESLENARTAVGEIDGYKEYDHDECFCDVEWRILDATTLAVVEAGRYLHLNEDGSPKNEIE